MRPAFLIVLGVVGSCKCGPESSSGTEIVRVASDPPPRPEPVTINVDPSVPAEQRAAVSAAIDIFKQVCPKWGEDHWRDVASARASYDWIGESDSRYRKYGWVDVVAIEIQMRDHAQSWGKPTNELFHGELLRYVLGGGKKPGIIATQPAAKIGCNLDASRQEEAFVNAPALKFLAGRPPKSRQRR